MIGLYAGFIALVGCLLALDLGVFHRKPGAVSLRGALGWSAVWISLGLGFAGLVYLGYEHHWLGLGSTLDQTSTPHVGPDGVTYYNDGGSAVLKYLTGFLVEKSLAVDNIFVIAMIFGFFAVPPMYQHRVLFWGIVGALVMRGAMIALGATLITRVDWIIYVFGGFLILTGVKMLVIRGEGGRDLGQHVIVRMVRRVIGVTERYHGERFFVRAGALMATPLFLALVLVELTDVIFAVDSIPAIFAITTDPFLVFTSNVFAILGLRSLYFALAGMIDSFRYLKVSLSLVLVVIGAKMMTHGWLRAWLGDAFNFYVLGVVGGLIAAGVLASLLVPRGPVPTSTAA